MGTVEVDEDTELQEGETFSEDEIVEVFIENLTLERRLSNYTTRNYRHALSHFFGWLRVHSSWAGDLNAVSKSLVRSFLVEQQPRLSRRTLRNHASGIRSFFKFGMARGFVLANPFQGVILPKLAKTLPKFLTESQVNHLLDQPIQLIDAEGADPFVAWRDRLVLELL